MGSSPKCDYSNMILRHYGIACGLLVYSHYGSLFGYIEAHHALFFLFCPKCWEVQLIHQLGDGIWALHSFPHCLFDGGGKRRTRVGVESFILKAFLPPSAHVSSSHVCLWYPGDCIAAWARVTASSHPVWKLAVYSKWIRGMRDKHPMSATRFGLAV